LSYGDDKFASGDMSEPRKERRFFRAAILNAYAEAARSLGVDPFHMLRKARLPVSALEAPDQMIPVDQFQQLVESTARAASCETFGLLVGKCFRLSMKGPLGLLAHEQATLGGAIEIFRRYIRYQNDNLEIRTLERDGGILFAPFLLSAQTRRDRHMVEMSLAMYVQIIRDLIGQEWRPTRVCFVHAAPRDLLPYESFFGAVEFGGDVNGFFLSHADLQTPLPDSDAAMAREITRLIERGGSPPGAALSDRLRDLIVNLLPEGHCTVDAVAQHLGVDRRTIHRRLAAEGRSFTQLREEARRELAAEQVRHGEQPLSVVTHMLGFSSQSTFSRWFRQTYGMQPSEYRRLSHDM